MKNIEKTKVGVHVRLGDYLHTNLDGVFHKINYQDYLKKQCLILGKVEYLFFSDDKKLLNNISSNKKFKSIIMTHEVEDLFALSQCDSIII